MTEREQRIRERARELWEQAGRPDGRDAEFLELAQSEIDNPGRDPKRSPGGPGDPEPPRG
jgi:hypothetical protein